MLLIECLIFLWTLSGKYYVTFICVLLLGGKKIKHLYRWKADNMILIVYFSFITKYNFSYNVCFSCAVIFTFLCFVINVIANAHVCAGDSTPLSNCYRKAGCN